MTLLSDIASFLGATVAGMTLGGLIYAGVVIAGRILFRPHHGLAWRFLRLLRRLAGAMFGR